MANEASFKQYYNLATVKSLAHRCAHVVPKFRTENFIKETTMGLEDLQMKDRVRHIASALHKNLDPYYPRAVEQIKQVAGVDSDLAPMSGFEVWPLCHFVETFGLEYFEESLDALYHLTPLFTAEFAIRPFLNQYPELTLQYLDRWSSDPNPHVRRLVSEGTRPRLPWAGRLPAFQSDPSQLLELLWKLRTDPDPVVRRSVANNLNDIAKDHPDKVVETVIKWSKDTSNEMRKLIRHACRTLIKQGHPGVFEVIGFTANPLVEIENITIACSSICMGEALEVSLKLRSLTDDTQRIVIDYNIHHRKANGKLLPKVFKWTTQTLKHRQSLSLTRKHKFRVITTRRYYTGEHIFEVLINGQPYGQQAFILTVDTENG
ncbi:DNA alkylation repair protein [Candidatus Marithrix sp. Canyon 246]|uniref:DNA alkylation repair protein n=1 Tax=Candidatus Marithrix sp. Canyon 246 TaxID=1827136 RepID=UPI00084A12EB|nr:DNA alkylation repair protein [Candidatus Marithrix sp. Canyon 246]